MYDSSSLPVAYCYHSEADKDETDPDDKENDQNDRVRVTLRVEINFVSPRLKICGVCGRWKTTISHQL